MEVGEAPPSLALIIVVGDGYHHLQVSDPGLDLVEACRIIACIQLLPALLDVVS